MSATCKTHWFCRGLVWLHVHQWCLGWDYEYRKEPSDFNIHHKAYLKPLISSSFVFQRGNALKHTASAEQKAADIQIRVLIFL